MTQQIRFCAASDGVQLAYATHGRGPPIVKVANWLTHLEFDWRSPLWSHWLEALSQGHTLIRYDERGCGLSDRDPPDLSFDTWVDDLEAVVDAAGLERFSLLGISQGAPVAVSFAARRPERVSHLILYGGYARGRLKRGVDDREEAELLLSLMRVGWGRSDPAFRQVFANLFLPGASREQIEWFDELQRVSSTPEDAFRIAQAWSRIDVSRMLRSVTTPTLVLHARGDVAVPFAEGRLLAAGIPGARFVSLEGRNHLLLRDEPAWPAFLEEARDFLAVERPAVPPPAPPADERLSDLSAREHEVLELVAAGMTNEEIAARLYLSVRTVERHLSNVYAKLGVSGKAARAAVAARYSRRPPPALRDG
jgi:pimeloyl-ACP methyl ester carboxylesterase/DNA-binding CsgD family transcriptional regulator